MTSMSRDAWERIKGFDLDDGPPEPACKDCNDLGRIPSLLRPHPDLYFAEWAFIDCPCQRKT